MAAVADEGVCIRVWDWSETSQTVSIFTRSLGLVRAVAKGSKRDRSPFSGGIDPLTRADLTVITKPAPNMAVLTSWDLAEVFLGPRRSLAGFYAGLYAADLVQQFLSEPAPHPVTYDALVACLRRLAATDGIGPALLEFQWALLDECGYRPELAADAATGQDLPAARVYRFSPRRGGLVASPGGDGSHGDGDWRVRAETVAALRAVSDKAGLSGTPPGAIDRANRLLGAYAREVIGREIPSMLMVFPAKTAPARGPGRGAMKSGRPGADGS